VNAAICDVTINPAGRQHFRDKVIVLCVRWYLRYPLSYRNLEEMMAERGLAEDHSTIVCLAR
jgi:transposase-like protein